MKGPDTFDVTVRRNFRSGDGKLHRRGEALTLLAGDVRVLLLVGMVDITEKADLQRIGDKLHTPEVTGMLQHR